LSWPAPLRAFWFHEEHGRDDALVPTDLQIRHPNWQEDEFHAQ
jgi:hypothetical protein